jgi:5-methylcytosine-specific restriction endonuclease McrA
MRRIIIKQSNPSQAGDAEREANIANPNNLKKNNFALNKEKLSRRSFSDNRISTSVGKSKKANGKFLINTGRKQIFYNSQDWAILKKWAHSVSGGHCACCGKRDFLQVDHVRAISVAPDDCLRFTNVQVLCIECNRMKSNISSVRFFRPSNEVIIPAYVRALSTKWALYFPPKK